MDERDESLFPWGYSKRHCIACMASQNAFLIMDSKNLMAAVAA